MSKKIEDKDAVIRELSEMRYKRGISRRQLITYLKDTYGLNQSRAYDLIREMMEQTADAYHKTHTQVLSDSIEFLEEMRTKALGAGEDKLALEWSKELHRVSQLYVQKVEIEAKNIEGISINIKKNDDEKE